jgi:hypothetical protein
MVAINNFPSRLAAARDRANLRRCEAFVDYAPTVCGLRLRPITLASYNQLVAFQSPLINGEAVDLEAVLVFVWLHHPDFGQDAHAARRRVFRAAFRALRPRYPNFNTLVHMVSGLPQFRWLRRFRRPTAEDLFSEAAAEIRRQITEALEDFPREQAEPIDERGQPKLKPDGPSVALLAQILHLFAREYRLSPQQTEALPMRRVVQLLRECYVASGAKGIALMHPEESRVWREYLDEPVA